MSTALLFAAALLATQDAPSARPAPEMRVEIGDLDFQRDDDLRTFADRVRTASRAFCDRHLDLVTPDRLGDSSVCRSEMRRLAYRALPEERRRQVAVARASRVVR